MNVNNFINKIAFFIYNIAYFSVKYIKNILFY